MINVSMAQGYTLVPEWDLICYQLQQSCWYIRPSYYFTEQGELVWVVEGEQGNRHLATDGGSVHEALWKLYCLAQNRDEH